MHQSAVSVTSAHNRLGSVLHSSRRNIKMVYLFYAGVIQTGTQQILLYCLVGE